MNKAYSYQNYANKLSEGLVKYLHSQLHLFSIGSHELQLPAVPDLEYHIPATLQPKIAIGR